MCNKTKDKSLIYYWVFQTIYIIFLIYGVHLSAPKCCLLQRHKYQNLTQLHI